jgi:hypothetical protein
MSRDIIFRGLDKKSFLKELHDIKQRCLKESNYDPESDIAYLIVKFNLDSGLIWMKIKKYLSL